MPLSAGYKIGPYEIASAIGKGGMGEVYQARDTKLARMVAIKALPAHLAADASARERLRREAASAAALDHPFICKVYEIVEDGVESFVVMEYIAGETLHARLRAGSLPLDEALRIAGEVAEALEKAHGDRFVHRDLKPANIMLSQGHVKVMDFGLAKRIGSDGDAQSTISMPGPALTVPGTAVGTPEYMSPEQVRGEKLDARSDLFSFGILLSELLGNSHPFRRLSASETMAAILRDAPDLNRELPAGLAALIRRLLAKAPGDRYASMAEVRSELTRAIAAGAEAPVEERAIAVLPFTNIGGDKEEDYFSDGLAEEILNALSQVEGLRVAARTSSFSFKGRGVELSEIAAKLRVSTVLEGSVRRAGKRIRVTVQLVDVANGFQLWSERYDRQLEDIFEVQDDIARSVAERFRVAAGSGVKRFTSNLEAYQLYLKGRHYWHQRSPMTLRLAIECFEQTIRLDPKYALAWAGLADCYAILWVYGFMPAEQTQPKAREAVSQAVALAPAAWEVNCSRGLYVFYFERDWREAGAYFRAALQSNPRSSLACAYQAFLLALDGREAEARVLLTNACRIDPLSPYIQGFAAAVLISVGRFSDALGAAHQALELQPGYLLGLWFRGISLCGLGRNEEAIQPLERALALTDAPGFIGNLGLAHARAGRLDEAKRLLGELEERQRRGEYVPAFTFLAIHLGLGDVTAIRLWLAKTIAEGTPIQTFAASCDPFLESLRRDPEIERMLRDHYGR